MVASACPNYALTMNFYHPTVDFYRHRDGGKVLTLSPVGHPIAHSSEHSHTVRSSRQAVYACIVVFKHPFYRYK